MSSFPHYHATFYRQVEALSVTPFAARAIDRGLTGVLVGLTRHDRLAWNPYRPDRMRSTRGCKQNQKPALAVDRVWGAAQFAYAVTDLVWKPAASRS